MSKRKKADAAVTDTTTAIESPAAPENDDTSKPARKRPARKKAPEKARATTPRKKAAKKARPAVESAIEDTPAPSTGVDAAEPVSVVPATGSKAAETSRRKPDAPHSNAETGPRHVLQRTPMVVRWRDLDAFNHVNNAQYLTYLEEARLLWMMALPGLGLDDDVAPVVAAAHLNYRRPIEWPGNVEIELFVERLGNTSVSLGHRIVAARDDDVVYCDGHVVLVWIDRRSGKAAPLPEGVRIHCAA